jgi:hypothetical protein
MSTFRLISRIKPEADVETPVETVRGAEPGAGTPKEPTVWSLSPSRGSTWAQWKHTADSASMAATKGNFMKVDYHGWQSTGSPKNQEIQNTRVRIRLLRPDDAAEAGQAPDSSSTGRFSGWKASGSHATSFHLF